MSHRYSTLSDFHRCGKYYEWKHVHNLDDGLGSSADIVFGTSIHMAIQDLFEGGDGLDIFNVFWVIQRDKGLIYTRYKWDELHLLGNSLIEVFRDEHMKKFVVANDSEGAFLLERKMHGSMGENAFSGTADFIGTFRGQLSLVDWKTSAMPYDQYKLVTNEQIYGYVHLAKQALGLDIPQGVYAVAVKDHKNPRWQFKVTSISQEKLNNVIDNITQVCNTLSRQSLYTRNPNACVVGKRVCPFFKKCYVTNSSGGASGGEETEGSDS